MPKAAILVGIAGSKRKFVAGQMSELCFYLRIDGREINEITSFAPHWQILKTLKDDLRDFAGSIRNDLDLYVKYNFSLEDEPGTREFVILNGWRNCFTTGNDVRCQPLPVEAIDVLKAELISLGLKEVKN